MKLTITLFTLVGLAFSAFAQDAVDTSLARHDFFYAGQSKQRRMFIVRMDRLRGVMMTN
jgi:hypothetical protein